MTSRNLQALAVLILGASLGYVAASSRSASPCASAVAQPTCSSADVTAEDCACFDEMAKPTLLAMTTEKDPETLLAQATPKAGPKGASPQASNGKKPNILFIMGDDIGCFNIGAYHRGIMSGKTPNLDKLASQG